jgi:hypothetical protein
MFYYIYEQDYEEMSIYDFIRYIDDNSPFLKDYLDYLDEENFVDEDGNEVMTAKKYKKYNSLINRCIKLENEYKDPDADPDTYDVPLHKKLKPLMKWMTEECGQMNEYYKEDMHKAKKAHHTKSTSKSSKNKKKLKSK